MPTNTNLAVANSKPRPLAIGVCIVKLQELKRRYAEMEHNKKLFRQSLGKIRPGEYENYKVVAVKEVTVKEHTRRAHTRLLLPK